MKINVLIIIALFCIGCRSVKKHKTETITKIENKKVTEIDTTVALKPIEITFRKVEIKDTTIISKDKKSKIKLKNTVSDNGKIFTDIDIEHNDSVDVKAKITEETNSTKEEITKDVERKGFFEIFKTPIIIGAIILIIILAIFFKSIITYLKTIL